MDEFFTAEERRFRDHVRAAIAEMLPEHLAAHTRSHLHMTREIMAEWNRILHTRGWSAHHWPEEFGGPGWTPIQRFIFESELARADAPPISVFGIYLVGPTLYSFGTEAQKTRYLPGILSGDEFWCQGYSEPDAGSDLARLKTTARKAGDKWIVNGQKAWTSEGHFADHMILLARTNMEVKPQAGLSLFVVPMSAAGLSVQPVITIDGAHSVNSVFLDDVELDADALIGEVDQGWTYAKFLLNNERTNNAQVHKSRREFEKLKSFARQSDGLAPIEYRERFAMLETELAALEITVLRVLADEADGRDPGAKASILKVIGSQLQQSISELAMEMLGEEAVAARLPLSNDNDDYAAHWAEKHLFRRVVTIYAGTNEIQKTIIAKTVFRG